MTPPLFGNFPLRSLGLGAGHLVRHGVRYDITGAGYLVKDRVRYYIDATTAPSPFDPGQHEEALRGIRWAGIILAVGLVLELASTLWTFQKSLAAGALYVGDLDCSPDGRRQILHKSFLTQETCSRVNESVDIYMPRDDDYIGDWTHLDFSFPCNITDTSVGQDSFLARCSCDGEFTIVAPCVWYPAEADYRTDGDEDLGICFAQPMIFNDTLIASTSIDGVYLPYDWGWGGDGCRPTTPPGTFQLSVTSLVVSVGSQLVEAILGFKYLMNPRRSPALMIGGAVFEALGVAAIAGVIIFLPGFFEDDFFGLERTQRELVFSLTWASAATAIVGAVAEYAAELPDYWGRGRPYLGVLGNALVWLGAATLEVVVAAFQTWRVTLSPGPAVFLNEIAGLVAMEVVALVSMWSARFLWVRSKEMLSPVLARASFPFARRKNVALL